MRSLPAILACATLLAGATARASPPPPLVEGGRLNTSQYAIDYFTGPVVGSARVTGLGGAFSGISEGVDADGINPAAPSQRLPWSYKWFDYDTTIGVSLPGIFSWSDFENTGDNAYQYRSFFVPNAGLNLQFGRTALGISYENRRYSVDLTSETAATAKFSASFHNAHVLLSRSAWRGQLLVGVGLRLFSLDLEQSQSAAGKEDTSRISLQGIGLETGLLIAPTDSRWRLALCGRYPVPATPKASDVVADAQGDLVGPGNFYMPNRVVVPWELEVGFAWEFGERPLNPEWINPNEYGRALRAQIARERALRAPGGYSVASEDAQREIEEEAYARALEDLTDRRKLAVRDLARRHYLVTASLLYTGPVDRGVGTESMLKQTVERSGEIGSWTPRLGIEAEPFLNWMQLRMGTYVEPGRLTSHSGARFHLTIGCDVKILPWTVFGLYSDDTWWGIGAVIDVAERYTNLSFRLGVWH